jgi:ATP-binding cassette, subfamily B, bacterial PglK
MRRYLFEIITLLGEDKKKIPGLLMLFLAVSMLDLAGIGLIGPYIGLVSDPSLANDLIKKVSHFVKLPSEVDRLLLLMSCLLVGLFAVKGMVAIWINYIIVRFSLDQEIRLRKLLMKSYQSLEYNVYINRNSSEYIHSTQSLVGQYAGTVVNNGMKVISDGIVAFLILLLLVFTNVLALTLLVSLLIILIYVYDRVFRKNVRYYGQEANKAAIKMVQGIHEGIEGMKEIRILGAEKYFYKRVSTGAEDNGYYHARSTVITTAPRYLLEFILVLFVVLLVIVSNWFDQDNHLLLPTLGMFGLAAIRLLPAANILSSTLMQLRFSRDSISRLYQDVKSAELIKTDIFTGADSIDPFRSLSISNISFQYNSAANYVLHKLTLNIHQGESIGFIGYSGSGKTTLIDVLLGLLKLQDGEIKYNGKPLSVSLHDWRAHVAYLPQEIFLIDHTLRNNIALGVEDEKINDELLSMSIEKARLSELVEQLPNGVNTMLGEGGVRISGGQRQRVALARAFYHQRDVLIMDEATSALDSDTEKEIVEEIRLLKGEKTIIVIAHRLTTLQFCDKIYWLKNGNIAASGTPDEMLESADYKYSDK